MKLFPDNYIPASRQLTEGQFNILMVPFALLCAMYGEPQQPVITKDGYYQYQYDGIKIIFVPFKKFDDEKGL